MTTVNLPNVTLVCADCLHVERAIAAVERSRAQCNFGAVKFLTSLDTKHPHVPIPAIKSINDYSAFCLKNIHAYVDTTHMLVVQHDGWVINGQAWEDDWLNYDYVGPLFEQERDVNAESVGSGGFSLRSKRFMAAVSELLPPWDGKASFDGNDGANRWGHEDGVICKYLRRLLTNRGFKFAPPDSAARFAFGRNRVVQCQTSFGFHGYCPETALRGVSSESVLATAEIIRAYYETNSEPITADKFPKL